MSKKILLIILFGFILNFIISFFYIEKFNFYETINTEGERRHGLIKGINENHWNKAYKLKKDIDSGKSFFKSGDIYDRNYLPSINFYLYSIISGDKLYENNVLEEISTYDKNIQITKTDKKFYFLVFQSILYCLAIFFLIKTLSFYLDKKLLIILTVVLSFEPSINQWHSSFFSASIFTSIQIFLLSFLFKIKKNYFDYFIIGFILALLFAQRSAAMFYIFILVFIFVIFIKKNKIKKIFIFTLSYLLFLSFIVYHNYNRSGLFYVTPLDQRTALFHYFEPNILHKANNSKSLLFEKERIFKKINNWKESKKLNLNNERDLLAYYNEMKKNSIISILNHPIISFKLAIKKTLHSGLLDPVYIFFFHKTEYKGNNSYYGSETHRKIIKYRLFYSILVYLISIYGFYYSFKYIKKEFIFFSSLSYLYFLGILGWMGWSRYYTACIPFLLIFFSVGVYQLYLSYKK